MLAKSAIPRLTSVFFATAQLFAGTAVACKDRMYPEHFPLAELAAYAHVIVVRVEKIQWGSPDSWYAPPFTFEGRIEKSLQGPLHSGDAIRAATSADEFQAVCPIHLEQGKTYLLMLNGTSNPYVLPRFGSLRVASDDKLFAGYVRDIASSVETKAVQ
jgi:hypothetical protein